jgi:hypothetical protein
MGLIAKQPQQSMLIIPRHPVRHRLGSLLQQLPGAPRKPTRWRRYARNGRRARSIPWSRRSPPRSGQSASGAAPELLLEAAHEVLPCKDLPRNNFARKSAVPDPALIKDDSGEHTTVQDNWDPPERFFWWVSARDYLYFPRQRNIAFVSQYTQMYITLGITEEFSAQTCPSEIDAQCRLSVSVPRSSEILIALRQAESKQESDTFQDLNANTQLVSLAKLAFVKV